MEYTTFIIAIDVPKEAMRKLYTPDEHHSELEIAQAVSVQISERHGFKVIGSL